MKKGLTRGLSIFLATLLILIGFSDLGLRPQASAFPASVFEDAGKLDEPEYQIRTPPIL